MILQIILRILPEMVFTQPIFEGIPYVFTFEQPQVKQANMLSPPKKFFWKFVKSFLVIAVFLVSQNSLFAQDADPQSCSSGLPEARNQLFMGDFDQAMALIRPCIEANAYSSVEELVQAYELLANVYIAVNDEAQAREVISSLLAAAPGYEPDPDQSRSDFVFLVNEMRAQLTPSVPTITDIATEDLSNSITWSFTNSPPVASFTLFRGPHPDSLTQQATISIAELSLSPEADESVETRYEDADVEYSTRYYYALEAIGENGNSSTRSPVVDVITPDAQRIEPIAEVEEPAQASRKRISPWVFVGGGVVAGGLAAVLAGGGGGGGNGGGNGDPTTLLGPPPLP